ncbi:hypothetical protein ALC53_03209, partial [Atta colombica]
DESEGCDRDGFEETFYALFGRIRELISPSSTLRVFIFSLLSSSVRESDNSMHIRLPKLNLPTFLSANVDTYELTTVTYGTAFASFLATRCLKHLAEQHVIINSLAVRHASFDFYVDDMLTGADTIDELKLIRDETIQLLKLGAFDLSKWTSNCPELLQIDNRNRMPVIIGDNATDSCILGMQWNQCQDTFQFLCKLNTEHVISKRIVLSEIAKLLDPLGLLGPVIVIAKIISTFHPCIIDDLLNKCSNLNKICRIIAYCLRLSKAHLSPAEIATALDSICRAVQQRVFYREYETSSNILSLSPFLDESRLMRVGGRLKNSNLAHSMHCKHILYQRIIEHKHTRNLHAGLQATMAFMRQRFWSLSLRSTVRGIIQKCVTCFRAKSNQSEALMGSLPASRVNVSRPFSRCGVDYVGPLLLREGKHRSARSHKAYSLNDLAYPGHFLVGTTLNGLPCIDLSDVNENRLLRWQRVEQIRQHFWRRWSNEYLHSLQARTKWIVSKGTQLSTNQLVLIRQPNLAPLQWAMRRVLEVHLAPDGIARTATIKIVKGSYVRPLSKLLILPKFKSSRYFTKHLV